MFLTIAFKVELIELDSRPVYMTFNVTKPNVLKKSVALTLRHTVNRDNGVVIVPGHVRPLLLVFVIKPCSRLQRTARSKPERKKENPDIHLN